MTFAILILAAGTSTRMGVTKQLLPIGKTTLLGIAIEIAIQSNADKVYCVLGAHAKKVKQSIKNYQIESILNPNYKEGLSSSIVSGINHIVSQNFDATLIMLGDQPFITKAYLNEMIFNSINHPKKIIASNYNETYGVPAIIPKSNYNELLELKGDKGAKSFLNSKRKDIIQLENGKLIDIDTKKDYQELLNSKKTQ